MGDRLGIDSKSVGNNRIRLSRHPGMGLDRESTVFREENLLN